MHFFSFFWYKIVWFEPYYILGGRWLFKSNSNTTPMELSEKMKALEAARLQIEKQFGQGAIMKLGDKADVTGIEVIPSGTKLVDEAIDMGG